MSHFWSRLFFFCRANDERVSQQSHVTNHPHKPALVKIALDLMRGRRLPVHSLAPPQSEERRCKDRAAAQARIALPPEPPRLFRRCTTLGSDLALAFAKSHEIAGLQGPPAADLQGKDHQPSSRACSHQFWIRSHLPPARAGKSQPISIRCPSLRKSVPLQSRYQRCVDCQLDSAMQWESIDHNLQPATVGCVLGSPNPCSARANLLSRVLPLLCKILAAALSREKPLLPNNPVREHAARWWSKMSFGRPHPQMRQREVGGEATLEENPEQGRINPRQWGRRACGQ